MFHMDLLQVETFGSMRREEKVGFILEQMRLCLAKKDYIRTQIICKKINTKFFSEVDTPEVQVPTYALHHVACHLCTHLRCCALNLALHPCHPSSFLLLSLPLSLPCASLSSPASQPQGTKTKVLPLDDRDVSPHGRFPSDQQALPQRV